MGSSGALEPDRASVLPVGYALDDPTLGNKLAGPLSAHAGSARSLDCRSSNRWIVALDRFEVGQERPDLLGWAVGLHFVMDRRHGSLHKRILVVYHAAS